MPLYLDTPLNLASISASRCFLMESIITGKRVLCAVLHKLSISTCANTIRAPAMESMAWRVSASRGLLDDPQAASVPQMIKTDKRIIEIGI